MERGVLSTRDFEWLLSSLCQLHRIPFDADLLRVHCPPPHSVAQLLKVLENMGFEIQPAQLDTRPLATMALPFIAFERASLDPGAAGPTEHPALVTLVLIVQRDHERVLFFPAGSDQPTTLPVGQFLDRFDPEILTVERALPASTETGAESYRELKPTPFGFRWFAPELLRHKPIWRDVLLASLAIQVLGLGLPLFTQVVIDKVVVHQTLSTLQVVGAGMAIFVLFSAGMGWIRQQLILHTGNRVDAVLGTAVFRHLLHLPHLYFQRRPTGTLIARLHGIETIRDFITGAAVSLILDLPFMLVFLAVMFFYSWQLTLIAVALITLLAGLSLAVTPLLRARLNQQFLLGARNQSFLTEYVAGMETVKALQMEPQLESRYGDYLGTYLGATYRTRSLANAYQTLSNTLEQVQTLAILVVGALLVMNNDGFTIGMLVAFQMFAQRLSQPVLRLTGLYQEFQQASIAVRRLADLMDCPAEPHSLFPSRRTQAQGRIEIAGLGFRYDESQPWLYRGLDLVIPPGKTAAIMGPSGCGKSTLAKLLLGFIMPVEGSIRIDGIDTRHQSANELRSGFGVVPQETVLFSGTIYDNLVAAFPHASFEDVENACRIAEIHDVIQCLPQGYQTQIGEKGAGLSGGQKQRIAIARALLKRPRILIFDEATSNLDAETAEAFAATIRQLKGQVTMLFIAHQLPKGLQVDGVVGLGNTKSFKTDGAKVNKA
ncbi:MAG: ATP-binding cassette domain-containing protein [Thiobacillus sp.]|nr:ATP-binding cassette domain-containing protein [Thiobacillus sp.]